MVCISVRRLCIDECVDLIIGSPGSSVRTLADAKAEPVFLEIAPEYPPSFIHKPFAMRPE
uniref:Uncharacterized protein n=1 Tax=uncultured marine virus TaxID=186617 RepID=A0A0F7LBV3_9VIRU|nr:hypothetical protein [uncultured marine virus]